MNNFKAEVDSEKRSKKAKKLIEKFDEEYRDTARVKDKVYLTAVSTTPRGRGSRSQRSEYPGIPFERQIGHFPEDHTPRAIAEQTARDEEKSMQMKCNITGGISSFGSSKNTTNRLLLTNRNFGNTPRTQSMTKCISVPQFSKALPRTTFVGAIAPEGKFGRAYDISWDAVQNKISKFVIPFDKTVGRDPPSKKPQASNDGGYYEILEYLVNKGNKKRTSQASITRSNFNRKNEAKMYSTHRVFTTGRGDNSQEKTFTTAGHHKENTADGSTQPNFRPKATINKNEASNPSLSRNNDNKPKRPQTLKEIKRDLALFSLPSAPPMKPLWHVRTQKILERLKKNKQEESFEELFGG